MKYVFIFLAVLSLIIYNNKGAHPGLKADESADIDRLFAQKLEIMYEANFQETLAYIKAHEGFHNGHAYHCAAGHLTIGYGHVVKHGEVFPEQITLRQADSLLEADFMQALNAAKRLSPLDGSKQLALAHMIYSIGVGNFYKSKLRRQILEGENVDSLWMRWSVYYTSGGRKVQSAYARRIREWELRMYHRDDSMLQVWQNELSR